MSRQKTKDERQEGKKTKRQKDKKTNREFTIVMLGKFCNLPIISFNTIPPPTHPIVTQQKNKCNQKLVRLIY